MAHVCRFDAIKPTKAKPYPMEVCNCGDRPHTAYVRAMGVKCPTCGKRQQTGCFDKRGSFIGAHKAREALGLKMNPRPSASKGVPK